MGRTEHFQGAAVGGFNNHLVRADAVHVIVKALAMSGGVTLDAEHRRTVWHHPDAAAVLRLGLIKRVGRVVFKACDERVGGGLRGMLLQNGGSGWLVGSAL